MQNTAGAKCLGNFNYFWSFTIMVCLPVSILTMALVNYYGNINILEHQLLTMTEDQKKANREDALHAMFELADMDSSGHIEPMELANVLRSLGWSLQLKKATALSKKIGARIDAHGHFILDEEQFVTAMISGQIKNILRDMHIRSTNASMIRSKVRNSSVSASPSELQQQQAEINHNNSEQLVKWTLRSALVSNSLSGGTQLLLLAHTPVSRKVFQYFHCHDIAGRSLLRADYEIDCTSDVYYSYMSFVIGVLMFFTIALPTVISYYLFHNRKNLYSTMTHQRIGWLYEPFVRGAEFWQVHDLMMKMILTVSFVCTLCLVCWS